MRIHDLKAPPGSTKPRRRVGRGIAGKGGKTAGRGMKGQGARDTVPVGFEGGQMPLARRVPKLKGFVAKQGLVKVLGRGQLSRAVRVKAHAFSKSAQQAITSAGGSVEVLPPPFGHGRPAAKGNALTNR